MDGNTNSGGVMLADGKCQLVIDGASANANWNVIWQATEAILAICLRQQLSGTSSIRRKSFQRFNEEKD